MSIPTTIESLSVTAASNGPSGSDQRTIADDGLRQSYAFLKQLVSLATLASGSTVTPPSTAKVFSVSGVTTIATIASTNSWDGREITFIFQGILTLTNSSNLALPGSANITTAANDCAVFVQTGSGAWRCESYTRADGSWSFGNLTAAAFIPSGSTVPANGLYLKAANNPALASNTTLRWDVSSAGNHTIAAPGSGTALTVAGQAAGINTGIQLSGATTGMHQARITNTGGDAGFGVDSAAGGNFLSGSDSYDGGVGTFGATAFNIGTNNAVRIKTSSGGNVTVNAPSSGRALAVNAASGAAAGVINSVAAQVSYLAYAVNSVDGAFFGLAGSDGNIISDTTAGDVFARVESHDFRISTNSGTASSLVVTSDGRLYGKFLHNNAGAVTGTTNQYIASGTYTPTATAGTNVASASGVSGRWVRTGNVVEVSGTVTIDPTSATTASDCGISLPIASDLGGSNLSGFGTIGQGGTIGQVVAVIGDDSVNNRANMNWISGTDVASRNWMFKFQYEIV